MTRFEAVHQFHSGTAPFDAITQHMLAQQRLLRSMGWSSEIYAEHIGDTLDGTIRPIGDYRGSQAELLIVHHSMGHDAFDQVVHLPNVIVTQYHNVTPEAYFDDEGIRRWARIGREQLRLLAQRSRLGVAVSNYNRKEMLRAGFDRVAVLPPRTDFSSVKSVSHRPARSDDWLFVGRIVANKGQVDLVRAFAAYARAFDRDARLLLVGDLSHADYVGTVRDEATRLGVTGRVHLMGKVSEEKLRTAFAGAGVFVSLSEHEGFGVPLLEAMAAGVPVVALAAAAVPETMGGAGLLLRTKEPDVVAATVQTLRSDAELRKRMVERQHRRVLQVESLDVRATMGRVVAMAEGAEHPLEVQVQGPFETSYSLALMNRKLALALDWTDGQSASIYATEGPGDYDPAPDDLAREPDAAELYRRSSSVPYPDVVIRQMWPPRLIDSPGGITCAYFGWEESLVPEDIVTTFNRHADGIGAMSTFVADALRDSGVDVPICVVGNGVERPDPTATIAAPELERLKGFRFLHVSSGFPRKGVDVLLRAYFDAFDGSDDVSLVLKTFPNPHNVTGELLDDLRSGTPNPPDVRWIDRDLSEHELDGLYGLAGCLVHPARGEGFGLPVAEAMLAGIPVIALAHSGMADFVSEQTATTIPYRLEPAGTHLSVPGSVWAEPDRVALTEAMRRLAGRPDEPAITRRVDRARALIEDRFSWEAVAHRWSSFIGDLRDQAERPRVALVSTWNSRCGIAEYTKSLVDASADRVDFEVHANRGVELLERGAELGVVRNWIDQWHPDLAALDEALDRTEPEVVHLQFNFGFFELGRLAELIERQRSRRGVVITLHRTADATIDGREVSLATIAPTLAKVDRVIVHQAADAELLASMGLVENVSIIPIGTPEAPAVSPSEVRRALGLGTRPVLATFGFLVPHKGVIELIGAIDVLRREYPDLVLLALCARHPDGISAEYETRVLSEITRRDLSRHVVLVTDYLTDDVARAALLAADAVVLPYLHTKESSSAALRFVLPAGRPIIASDLPIFADARDALLTVPPGDVTALRNAVRRVLADPALHADLAALVVSATRRFRWSLSAAEHRRIYMAALRSRPA
ncbi:MAG: glycosyltransferase family 4 protein [Acidimicrobiales bacterium]